MRKKIGAIEFIYIALAVTPELSIHFSRENLQPKYTFYFCSKEISWVEGIKFSLKQNECDNKI